jgi:hypothetical protein
MKSKYFIIVLLISLSFNVGFIVAGLINANRQEPVIPQRAQRQRGTRFVQSDELREARRENLSLRTEFFQFLASEEFNEIETEEIIARLLQSQQRLESKVCLHFLDIRQNMTPEEASEFFNRFYQTRDTRERRQRDRGEHRARERNHERRADR